MRRDEVVEWRVRPLEPSLAEIEMSNESLARRQFHLLSFEGPDLYARAGGVATRVVGLAEALASRGFDTHLWFLGDPSLPGVEQRGRLTLHRWCQWISSYAPLGVYQKEDDKERDFSLPRFPRS
jgi:hypothetical protein